MGVDCGFCTMLDDLGQLEDSEEEFIHWGEPQLSEEDPSWLVVDLKLSGEDPSWLVVDLSQRGDSVVLTSPQTTAAAAYARTE